MTFTYGDTSITVRAIANTLSVDRRPLRQTVGVAADGTVLGSKPTSYEVFISFSLLVKASELNSVVSFLVDTVGIRGNTFTVTPDTGIDLGAGAGNSITARVWNPDELSVKMQGANLYVIPLELRKE